MGGQNVGRPRVLVVGGGIGGLCLAQGLRQAGIADVTVYERDTSAEGRMQGYRLRISPEGEAALRECLPRRAQDLLTATANDRHQLGLVAFDERLNPLPAPTFDDPRGDAPDRIDAVDRATLRRVLLAGIGDAVRFGKRFVRYEQAGGEVVAHFADGDRAVGDVLVAADGAHSAIRAQLCPDDNIQDLGVRAILSRTPRAVAIATGLPESLRDRFVNVTAPDGLRLALMPMVFRTAPARAAVELWPGLEMGGSEDYYMSVFSVHKDLLGLTDDEFFGLTGERLRQLVLDRTVGWHPDLRGVFAHAQPAETYPLALRATVPVRAWEPGPVIPLGDAVHLMPPTGGVGANTALRDASALCRALTAVARGEAALVEAATGYQAEMVRYATEAIEMSLKIARWSMKKIDVGARA
ncbi:FAD-dependent monooxygenase [Micromonospora sp. WMMA1363]|uniref:FAD-dependent oxidoreductase n=1 Tax=Micromonospora sp. WMMA1363 TaxID=3053985 RepID=UPI00259C87D0|nr:FAD-dependent monooxygenase [Micromonospora sp. WMMA1363]MDM4718168.1 FAD-dependent monooxygenase [Micromonospora sp. WMMA1363]